MRHYHLLFITAFVAGCAAPPAGNDATLSTPAPATAPTPRPPTAAAPGLNLSGYSPGFRGGYADGCASVDAARKRDEARFKSDPDYAQGWRDGNDICKRRK